MFNRITLLVALLCPLVAGAASGQVTSRQLNAYMGLYQVKADAAGVAFGCLRPRDTKLVYEAMVRLIDLPEGSGERAELTAQIDETWGALQADGLCGRLKIDAVMKRWDSDDEYPELIGVRATGWGGERGRTYWTRKAWLEPAE